MSSPNPALVSRVAAERMPRLALLLLCAAYVLPGQFARDPWKNADVAAFGTMAALAQGRTDWWAPELAGLGVGGALMPHWLGAVAIQALGPWLGDALAARVPFALLLGLTLAFVWYACFHLALTDAAQPVPFAFGGEADPVDYARALADGALLALLASLGLLQLGHETTPELMQLAAMSGVMWALAAAPHRRWPPRLAVVLGLAVMGGSGAPTMAVCLGAAGTLICTRSAYPQARSLSLWAAAGTLAAAAVGAASSAWALRIGLRLDAESLARIARLLLWFGWPAWPLALWTLWRWRRHVLHRHIAVPLSVVAVGLGACVVMGGNDRALLLGLPGLAVLAAFALPTLARSTGAAIDWFSVFFFSAAALTIWVIYVAMITGVPAKPAANVAKLAPGFEARFDLLACGLAILATLAWAALVRWRTARHRHPLWKSLVLPASGVALCWMLLMSLWLPLLDYDRSYRGLVARVQAHVPAGACVLALDLSRSQVAALEVFAGYRVEPASAAEVSSECRHAVSSTFSGVPRGDGWKRLAEAQRPTDRRERLTVWGR